MEDGRQKANKRTHRKKSQEKATPCPGYSVRHFTRRD